MSVLFLRINAPYANLNLKSDAEFEASQTLRPLAQAGATILFAYIGGVIAVTLVTRERVPTSQ
jgi:hypothetical protein